jgi:2-dehydropantoate 2-reductase
MKIAIVGPGAIGCLFAGLLGRAGHEVWLVDHNPSRARQLAKRGVYVSGLSGEFHTPVRATLKPEEVGGAELALIAVKSYDTAEAAQAALRALAPTGSALTVQNGLGNIELLQQVLGADRVLAGSTAQGATLVAPGQVHHAGLGPTVIGEPGGAISERLLAVEMAFAAGGIQTELTADLPSVLWAKLASNAGINPVATLAQVRNGGIMESAHLRQALGLAVSEAVQVAEGLGIRLPYQDMVAHTEEVCQRTASNVNSMLQDVRRQRRTEVEAINGAVVRHGAAQGVPTPTNALLAALIRGVEETYSARKSP